MPISLASLDRKKVLGYPVDLVNQAAALKTIETAWQDHSRLQVVTLNSEMIISAQQDSQLDRVIRSAELVIPDGSGVVWALRLAGETVNRLPGIELAQATLAHAAVNNIRVALLGGRQEVLSTLLDVLPKSYPGLNIVIAEDGFFSNEEEASVLNKIVAAEPQLLLLALGVPKQEFLAERWKNALPKTVIIGVGGSFDVWAGRVKRAPQSFQRLHLEWLYRLIKEPWRYKRMGATLPKFALQVFYSLLRKPPEDSNLDK